MLPLIGYILCVMLFTKGLEMFSSARIGPDQVSSAKFLGGLINIIAALVFALLLFNQDGSLNELLTTNPPYGDPSDSTAVEVNMG